jgi:hypothetical protein
VFSQSSFAELLALVQAAQFAQAKAAAAKVDAAKAAQEKAAQLAKAKGDAVAAAQAKVSRLKKGSRIIDYNYNYHGALQQARARLWDRVLHVSQMNPSLGR